MKSRFQKKSKKQYGGDLDENEIQLCKNLDLFIKKTGVTEAEIKADLGNRLKNCNTLDKDNCVIMNYLNSDEWYKITDQLRKQFFSNDLKSAMETQKEQLETQITELQNQILINKYLLANVFNATTINKAAEEAFKEVLNLKNNINEKFQVDCGICSQQEIWNEIVQEAEKEGNGGVAASVTKLSEQCVAAQSGGRRSTQKKRKLGRRSYKLH